jgi:hypothetical protein
MGQTFLSTSLVEGQPDAVLAYVGLQLRGVMDVFQRNGLQLELGVHARGDLERTRRTLVVRHYEPLGPSETRTEEWNVGGIAVTALLGLSYQF